MTTARWALAAGLAAAGCLPTTAGPNVTPPSVATVSPTDGARAVPLATVPQLCFSEPMDQTSLTGGALTLGRLLGHHVTAQPIAVSVDPDGLCATLDPNGPLAPSSGYRIEITTAAHSAAGASPAHTRGQKVVFTASFTTTGAPAQLALVVPADGTVAAPLDLATLVLVSSRPLLGTQAPLTLTPEGGPTALGDGGELLTATPPAPLTPGEVVSVAVSPALRDPDGNPPATPGALGFQVGGCAEGSPPAVGGGTAVSRDRDAILLYEVDRPCLCGATIEEPGCPTATAVVTPASCSVPYDPCQGGLLCGCEVPLVGLCPSGQANAMPEATGWNGELGQGQNPTPFQLADPLPALALDELMLAPAGTRAAGAYLELVSLAEIPMDLLGLALADCRGTQGCAIPSKTQPFGPFLPGGPTALAPHGYALLVDARFDATLYPGLPPTALLLAPLDRSPLLALKTDRPQPVGIFGASGGAPISTFDGSVAVSKGLSIERVDPTAPDPLPGSWAVGSAPGGTPGACNSVTPAAACAEARLP